ncbi:hypothetical protein EKO27_g4743 [Xylaria grammica]|uniref:Uncharacterized protein n=1 Tax=Xylaria grammica TaxID=363999 RepID=A0A439D7I6_9PEZI|nr:hypothetical protein F5X98DRAFT_213227 [Xylaria grammica]RWA10366.1 hypothetical protein EKO27_g4743 [Xylaria grammica]GAW23614.1 hypothetical protein ANO14919_131880 [Xylariales sp. No.14919]
MRNAKVLSAATLAGTSLAVSVTSTSPACSSSLEVLFSAAPTVPTDLLSYFATAIGTGPITAPGHTTALPDLTLEDPKGYQDLICSVAQDLPGSLLPDFASYGGALLSYGSVHVSEYDAYITDCITTGTAASTLTSDLHKMLDPEGGLCESTPTPTPGPSTSGTYPTGPSNGTYPTSTGSLPSPTTSTLIPTGAAARPTGVVAGAAVIGGILGAVALL